MLNWNEVLNECLWACVCLWHRDAIHWAKHYTLYTIFCCCHCHILSLFLFNLLFFSLLLSNERHTLNSFGDNDRIALFTHTLRKWSTPSFKWYINQSLFDYTAIFTHSHARTHTRPLKSNSNFMFFSRKIHSNPNEFVWSFIISKLFFEEDRKKWKQKQKFVVYFLLCCSGIKLSLINFKLDERQHCEQVQIDSERNKNRFQFGFHSSFFPVFFVVVVHENGTSNLWGTRFFRLSSDSIANRSEKRQKTRNSASISPPRDLWIVSNLLGKKNCVSLRKKAARISKKRAVVVVEMVAVALAVAICRQYTTKNLSKWHIVVVAGHI